MTIWKFPLTIADEQTITIPRDARILSVQVQQGEVCLWAEVAPQAINGKHAPWESNPWCWAVTFRRI